jgi:hypothetical protein
MLVARDELGFTALDPRECPENFEGQLCLLVLPFGPFLLRFRHST